MRITQIIEKIILKRKLKGISHEDMGFKLGISQAAYTNLENRTSKLSVERLIKIAEILEEPVVNFFIEEVQNQVNYNDSVNTDPINRQILDNLIKSKYEQITFLKSILENRG